MSWPAATKVVKPESSDNEGKSGIRSDKSKVNVEASGRYHKIRQASAPAFLSRPEEPELLSHPDQLGERSSLHPMHHLSAMKLDRD